MKTRITYFFLSAALLATARGGAAEEGPATKPIAAPSRTASASGPKIERFKLSLFPTILDPTRSQITNLTFSPKRFTLVDEKPAGVVKEPVYMGKPKYGAFQIGNGSRSITYFAIDEVEGKDGKLYVDTNQNGDLTDDGPGNWDIVKDGAGQPNYNTFVNVHASWGSPLTEVESGTYRLLVAHKPGQNVGGYAKTTGRVGEMKLAGRSYPIILAENTNDGLFTVPADGDMTRNDVSLYVDTENAGAIVDNPVKEPDEKLRQVERFNLAHPFKLDGQWYIARPSISGDTLSVAQANPPKVEATAKSDPPLETIQPGIAAPDFTVQAPDGRNVSLSDFKGKIVILDFWATWCGPCQAAMPGLEQLYQQIKDQNVVVLSVNVLDDKRPFDAWIKMNAGTKYNFNFGYDPAGKSHDDSIAVSKYKVWCIPSIFLITRDGKIAASLQNLDELKKSLAEHGISTKEK